MYYLTSHSQGSPLVTVRYRDRQKTLEKLKTTSWYVSLFSTSTFTMYHIMYHTYILKVKIKFTTRYRIASYKSYITEKNNTVRYNARYVRTLRVVRYFMFCNLFIFSAQPRLPAHVFSNAAIFCCQQKPFLGPFFFSLRAPDSVGVTCRNLIPRKRGID